MANKKQWIQFFNQSISEPANQRSLQDYIDLERLLFGGNIPPDVSLFIDDHKKDPNGADKFANYMLRQRPSGKYWFPRERQAKSDAQMKDLFKKESMSGQTKLVESAIRKIADVMMKKKPPSRRINEAVKGLNLEQPHSNLFIKGWGMDKNGNQVIIVGFPNDRGFSIQTNGTLPETHYITSRAFKELSEDELDVIGEEITDYVKRHGSSAVKGRLKTYGKRV